MADLNGNRLLIFDDSYFVKGIGEIAAIDKKHYDALIVSHQNIQGAFLIKPGDRISRHIGIALSEEVANIHEVNFLINSHGTCVYKWATNCAWNKVICRMLLDLYAH